MQFRLNSDSHGIKGCKNSNVTDVELKLKVECSAYYDLVAENVDDLMDLCSNETSVFEFIYKTPEVCMSEERKKSTTTICAAESLNSTIPGIIQSHTDFGESYPTNLDCEYTIVSPDSTKLFLNFSDFNLQYNNFCDEDRFTITYENSETNVLNSVGVLKHSCVLTHFFVLKVCCVLKNFEISTQNLILH